MVNRTLTIQSGRRRAALAKTAIGAVALLCVSAGCGSGSGSGAAAGRVPARSTVVARPTVTRPLSTTITLPTAVPASGSVPVTRHAAPRAVPVRTLPPITSPVPPLPRPAPIPALVAPARAGEGVWQPAAGGRLARGYSIYTTQLRPAPGYPAAGIAWINTAATRLALYAGTAEPYGSWPNQGFVGSPQTPSLLAAFNAGFKIYSYDTGWYEQGRSAVPLRPGAASLTIFTDGSATVANWGRDVRLGPTVAAVRQNLPLLVDHGQPGPTANDPGQWGAVLGGGAYTWRSGVGVTSTGDLVYVAGPELDPLLLARLLVAAGSLRAMELDINPEWVSFSTFTHENGHLIGGSNLLAGMYFSPAHYLQPFSRDFFAVFGR